jgi:hypothetical protein
MEWDLIPHPVELIWDLTTCQAAYAERRLRAWIEEYLQQPRWINEGLLRRVKEYSVYWPAPVLMPISAMERVAGPSPEFKFPQDPEDWDEKVNNIVAMRPQPDELPPVICWRDPDGVINLADGNHRVDALERLGYEYAWALVHDGPLRSEEELRQKEVQADTLASVKQIEGALAERFRLFSCSCEGSSELYRILSARIAEDEELLNVASMCQTGQPEPNLFLGAVHHLLNDGKANPLSRYYPSINLEADSPDLAFPAFRKFVLSHEKEIVEVLQSKLVQTNEVQRSAYLFPAIQTLSRLFGEKPLFSIEIGPSAGFNLLWDQYQYRYDGSDPLGLEGSSILLESSFRGDRRPELSSAFPAVSGRVGIDLNPIDLMDRDQVKWLQALIWPEQYERKARFIKAIRISLINPVSMIQGHATDILPSVLLDVPRSEVAMVYHTHVANQMSAEELEKLLDIVEEFGQQRDIVHLHNNIEPHLHATIYRNGERIEMPIAKTDGHARWIEWLA